MIELRPALLWLAGFCSTLALSQEAEEILVIGIVPSGAGIASDKIPFPVQTANAAALREANNLSIADFLRQGFGSVTLNDAQNNPLQPDLQYRGFTASPLLGLAQGISVYQNGVRINEPLGDSVNWDLLPESAIDSITLSGGANPLFGLNSLGGALAVNMKNGWNAEGTELEVSSGSFGRQRATVETGANDNGVGYYLNLDYFEEDGWRDQSSSEALNLYTSIGWRGASTAINLNYQLGDTDLVGNGAAPEELLNLDRKAIFTGPDITANKMQMLSLDYKHDVSANLGFGGNLFWRENKTDSFNGDGSEFAVCNLGGMNTLLGGLEEDDVEALGFDDDDLCDGSFTSAAALEDFLNATVASMDSDDFFNLEGFDSDELSGTGILSDEAINNISDRNQESTGFDFQWTVKGTLFGYASQVIAGGAWYKGESQFNSVLELAQLSAATRLTTGLGTGTFVDEDATSIRTETESSSLYVSATLDLTASVAFTSSLRGNITEVDLRDRSGDRPELNGSHRFTRLNPAVGLTWQVSDDHNLYASVSESSRAPTPIELACNEGVFELAIEFAIAAGEDPDDVELECRLPNAFLADPPLDDVVATNIELGARGFLGDLAYSVGLFNTTNHDDILFQTTGRSTGLFANVDKTRRCGIEGSLNGQFGAVQWFTSYSYIEATFEDEFRALSPNHDFADDEGEIKVSRGDRIPGIPQNQFKLGANYIASDRFRIGLELISNGSQVLRGDESNQLNEVDGYTLVNLRASYEFNDAFEIFARIDNVFDTDFESFGLLGEEPGEVDLPIFADMEVPVFLGAGQPRAGFIGVRYQF